MKLLLLLGSLSLISCESQNAHLKTNDKGELCYVEKSNGVTSVTCPNGTVEIKDGVDGLDGINGKNGLNGKDGKNFLSGKGLPNSQLGKDSELYLDLNSKNVYKKINGVWVYQYNLKGDKGDKGDRGLRGYTGSKGEKGDRGYDGLDGKDGKNGVNGINGLNGKDGEKGMTGATGSKGDKGDQGKDGKDGQACTSKNVTNGVEITCGDQVHVIENGKDGSDGIDGVDGKDGQDGSSGAVLNTVVVKKNTCTQVAQDVYVQNISSGYVLDFYMDSSCNDYVGGELNEYCDNVATSFGSYNNGEVGNTLPGSSTLCWVEDVQYSGIRLSNGDVQVKILDFN